MSFRLVTALILAVPVAPAPAQSAAPPTHRDLPYVPDGGPRRTLDLYLPKSRSEPVPLVVWIHGGGWQHGSKERMPVGFLVGAGFAVASINYRLADTARFPAQIEDVRSAIRWLRSQSARYGTDPARIGVAGSSAGGHLAALAGTSGNGDAFGSDPETRVQAVLDLFGPADFGLVLRAVARGGGRPWNGQDAVHALFGGPISEHAELAIRASPVTHVDAGDPPFLILHGSEDRLVQPVQSESLRNALQKAGVPVELVVLEGAAHGGPAFFASPMQEKIVEFFRAMKPVNGARRGVSTTSADG